MHIVLILRWCNYRLLFAVLLPVLPFQKADLAFQSQALEIRKAALENEVGALWRREAKGLSRAHLYAFSILGKTLQPFNSFPLFSDIH